MLHRLKGTIVDKDKRSITLDISGVGYKVFTTSETFEKCKLNEEVIFWTHLAVREDSMTLYGFFEKEERDFFELLITVSGIGPKTALGILNVSTVSSLKKAIQTGEVSHLTKVSGIGKKMADKLVLELKNKVEESEETGENIKNEVDAVEALKSLGYSQREAREALQKAENKSGNTSDKVKSALKILGK